jgi:hypothetical protein
MQGCCGGDDHAKTARMMAEMDRLEAWILTTYCGGQPAPSDPQDTRTAT